MDETLRVNGTAEIRDDEELRARFTEGRPPATVLTIHVREAFLHCGKALMRSQLWDPERHVERTELPTLGEMLRDQIGSHRACPSRRTRWSSATAPSSTRRAGAAQVRA